ncbi:MAG TPA: hypothetical protein VK459_04120 [Polyangiaceae bacterium]|nr:hypothetical protein [Polyangiaceae bacterium]
MENPQPDLEIRINGRPMTVRAAVLESDGAHTYITFLSRGVDCHEKVLGRDKGGDDAVEVGVATIVNPHNVFLLEVGGKNQGRTIRKSSVTVNETYAHPNSSRAVWATGTIDVATSTLEIRGKFSARGCGERVSR